jgi:hypothetical protein
MILSDTTLEKARRDCRDGTGIRIGSGAPSSGHRVEKLGSRNHAACG